MQYRGQRPYQALCSFEAFSLQYLWSLFFFPSNSGIRRYYFELFGSVLLICNSVFIATSKRTHFWNHSFFLTLGSSRYSRWYKQSEASESPQILPFGCGFLQIVLHLFHLPKYDFVLQQPWDLKRISVLHCLVLNSPDLMWSCCLWVSGV